jgi:hypothetical protein
VHDGESPGGIGPMPERRISEACEVCKWVCEVLLDLLIQLGDKRMVPSCEDAEPRAREELARLKRQLTAAHLIA